MLTETCYKARAMDSIKDCRNYHDGKRDFDSAVKTKCIHMIESIKKTKRKIAVKILVLNGQYDPENWEGVLIASQPPNTYNVDYRMYGPYKRLKVPQFADYIWECMGENQNTSKETIECYFRPEVRLAPNDTGLDIPDILNLENINITLHHLSPVDETTRPALYSALTELQKYDKTKIDEHLENDRIIQATYWIGHEGKESTSNKNIGV